MKNSKEIIFSPHAPAPIGTYSQAVKINNLVFISGQIPKDVKNNNMVTGDFKKEAQQVFLNLAAVAQAAGGELSQIIKLTIFLTDLNLFSEVNTVMQEFFTEPYPARSTVEISRLPGDSRIEIEAILYLGD